MRNIAMICPVALILSACATTNGLNGQAADPVFDVRASTHQSSNLLAIEDPLMEAVEARVNGDYLKAYNKFYVAWLAAPKSENVIVALTDMAFKTGHQETAYQATSKLDLDSETANPALLAAQVLAEISVGRSSDAELHLKQALARAPDDSRLWNALGNHHDSKKNWSQAEECYIQALTTGSSRSGLHNNLGMSHLMQGQTQAAISKFEQAVALDPSIVLYDNNRRLALALSGKFQDATKALSDNRAADILNDAGYIAKLLQETSKAKILFNAAITRSVSYHIEAHENLKQLLSEQSQNYSEYPR